MKLPQNDTAERMVVGICAWKPEYSMQVQSNRFMNPAYQEIFETICTSFQNEEPTDMMALTSKLEETGRLEHVGGAYAITTICSEAMTVGLNFDYYYAQLEKSAAYRRFIVSAKQALLNAHKMDEPLDKLLSAIISEAQEDVTTKYPNINHQLLEVMSELENTQKKERFPTGIVPLDERLFGGVERKELIVFAADTGVGKSIALGQMAVEGVKEKKKVALFSLEMSFTSVLQRYLSNLGGFNLRPQSEAKMTQHEYRKFSAGLQVMQDSSFWLYDNVTDLDKILASALSIKRKFGLDILVIDYLQRLDQNGDNREQSFAENVKKIKSFALRNDLVAGTASQLNDDGKLFGARTIGHEADIIVTLKEDSLLLDKFRRGQSKQKIKVTRKAEIARFEGTV